MVLESVRSFRPLLALLLLPLVSACPGPDPKPPDTTAPTSRAEPRGGAFATPVSVALSCEDGSGSGCAATYYTTDGTEPTRSSTLYTEPISLSATTSLKFFSVDVAGNAEGVKAEQYLIDTEAPTSTASPVGGTYYSVKEVTLSCEDGTGSGCAATYYTLDGSTPTADSTKYTSPIQLSQDATLKFFSVDQVGNAEAVRSETYAVNPDSAPPTVSASPQGGAYATAQTITLSCEDGTGSGCVAIHYTLDGSTPTTSSPQYADPLALSANTTLQFIGVDRAGNVSSAATETYVIDTQGPTSTATPWGSVYATAQTVTMSCDDGTGSGCAGIYYTLDGSGPDLGSTRYTGPISITTRTRLTIASVDQVGNWGPRARETYLIGMSPSEISAQIAAVRDAADGTVSLPIQWGLVTYVKPAVGTDPAGFFLQAEQAGPAVFFAVDPNTISYFFPTPGTRLSMTVTEKATVDGRVHVTALTNVSRSAVGERLEPMRADVSNVDLPAAVNDYESELIAISGTVSGAFSASGADYVAAPLATVGASGSNLQLRLPSTLQEQLGLAEGCAVTVKSALWRSNAVVQVTAWVAEDITVHSCPQ